MDKRRKRKTLWYRQEGLCAICGGPIAENELHEIASIDHIVPRAHGGDSKTSNLQTVHKTCNREKGCGCEDPQIHKPKKTR